MSSIGLSGRRLLAAVVVWLLASAVAAGVTVFALRSLAPESANDANTLSPIIVAQVYALLIAALAIVLRPHFREIVALKRPAVRDIYTWLRRRLSAATTIVITAAAFALIHGFPPILPLAFAIGIGFGWIRERSGSTVPAVVVHALHNALMIAVSYALTGWTARLPPWS